MKRYRLSPAPYGTYFVVSQEYARSYGSTSKGFGWMWSLRDSLVFCLGNARYLAINSGEIFRLSESERLSFEYLNEEL